jgi:signal transduction histidine kinase
MKSLEQQTMRIAWPLLILVVLFAAVPAVLYGWNSAARDDFLLEKAVVEVASDLAEPIETDLAYGGDLSVWEMKLCTSFDELHSISQCQLTNAPEFSPSWFSTNSAIRFEYNGLELDESRQPKLLLEVVYSSSLRSLIRWVLMLGVCWFIGAVYVARKLAHWLTERVVLRHIKKIQTSLVKRQPLTSEYSEISAVLAEIERVLDERTEAERRAAISSMVAAVSHDVRKPFSMIQLVTSTLLQMKDPSEKAEFLEAVLPELEGSRVAVEGLLQDIMQLNGESSLEQESVKPEELLSAALKSVFVGFPDANVRIVYEIEPELSVCVDKHKVNRVFANLLTNAAQAVKHNGYIWLRVLAMGSRVQFVIGNPGYIVTAGCTFITD